MAPVQAASRRVRHRGGKGYKLELEFPQLYNVASDPKEQWDILGSNLWIAEVAQEIVADLFQSMVEFPNVPPGADAPPGVEVAAT